MEVIPNHYFDLQTPLETLQPLETCFRLSLECASQETRKKALKKFVRLIKEESGKKITIYEDAFFRAPDMQYLSKGDRDLVKKHLFSTIIDNIEEATLKIMADIGPFLEPHEAAKITHEIIQLLKKGTLNLADINIREYFKNEFILMTQEAQNKVASRVE